VSDAELWQEIWDAAERNLARLLGVVDSWSAEARAELSELDEDEPEGDDRDDG
jgi:hypothetical protein